MKIQSPQVIALAAVLVLGSYNVRSAADDSIPITAARANGVYQDVDNEIEILMLSGRKLKVQLSLTNNYRTASGPSAASGFSVGSAQLKGDTATYVGSEDLDGDGVAEALIPATFAYLGLTASQSPSLIVMSRTSDCAVFEVGAIHGSGMCDMIYRKGRILIHEGCGEPHIEYQLLRGELKQTKRTPGQ